MAALLCNTAVARRGASVITCRGASTSIRRTFFASSTDHTTLLQNAKVHTVLENDNQDPYGKRQYLLIADGMPLDVVRKEPKLGLACLSADWNTVFDCKVINRSLGTPQQVCGRLVDAALPDCAEQGETPMALCRLPGLCRWVSQAISDDKHNVAILSELDETTYKAVEAIANNKQANDEHTTLLFQQAPEVQTAWEDLATEYVERGHVEEAALYQSKGGELMEIDTRADTSKDYVLEAGGAMAIFYFSKL